MSYLVSSLFSLSFLHLSPPCLLPLPNHFPKPPSAIDVSSAVEKTVVVSETASVPADSSTEAPPDSTPSEVSEVAVETDQDAPAAPSQRNRTSQINQTKEKLYSTVGS